MALSEAGRRSWLVRLRSSLLMRSSLVWDSPAVKWPGLEQVLKSMLGKCGLQWTCADCLWVGSGSQADDFLSSPSLPILFPNFSRYHYPTIITIATPY